MFYNCLNLENINLENIKAKAFAVTKMSHLFYNCFRLTSIDFSNFDTNKVTDMSYMLYNCTDLKSINLGKLNTSSVQSMNYLFYNCNNLISLNLSNFDFSSVKDISYMFDGCSNLKYINLFNLNTSKFIYSSNNFNYMFQKCKSLAYLNIFSFSLNGVNYYNKYMFNDIASSVRICVNDNNTKNYLLENNKIIICSDTCIVETNILIDIVNNQCVESCGNLFEYKNTCYAICPKDTYGFIYDEIPGGENKPICIENKPQGYFLDSKNNILRKCYKTCDYCYGEGRKTYHNCIQCNTNLTFLNNPNYNTSCYQKCPYYYYFDEFNNYKCTDNEICPENYNKSIIDENECISEYKIDITYINKKTDSYINNSYESSYNIYEEILKMANLTDIDIGNDFILKDRNVKYTVTSTKNQKENIDGNDTIIDLDYCEKDLKGKYNISINDSLYILKVDAYIDNILKIEYGVYYPFSINNLTQLNLSICKNKKIKLIIPVDIPLNEIDKFNKSSDLYTNICYSVKSESGADKILKDRQKDYKKNNKTICEEDCDFTGYNSTTKKAVCSCFTKIKLPLISEIKVDKEKLFSNFKDIRNIANFKLLTCWNLLLEKNNIFKNSSNYIAVILFILSILSIIIFICYDFTKTNNYINTLSKENKPINNIIDTNNKNYNIGKKSKKSKNSKKNKLVNFKMNSSVSGSFQKLKNKKNNKAIKPIIYNEIRNTNINNSKRNITAYNNNFTRPRSENAGKKRRNLNNAKKIFNNKVKGENSKKSKKKKEKKKQESYNDIEMNSLYYEDALKIDKRTYCQYYISLLKTKHNLIFTFFYNKDYNSKIIKIYIFFFTFTINYVVSTMFYSDTTMHRIYIDDGSFDFTYQLPQMFYSLTITIVLGALLNNLGLYENNIINYKKLENRKNKTNKLLFTIKLKISLFFVVTYILLISFWIYLGCFCAVYGNTQIHLLIDVSSSFCISFIVKIFLYLLPGIFRIPSLKNRKNKRPILFKISKILQLI